jgi:(1->4)-alpha-D-glucan 1-alpha-D-glucosylmutase
MTNCSTATADDLLRLAIERINAHRRLPESTYRLQFHAGFTFRDATAIVPYLRDLGITHVYASPYLKARPGSTHGYDVIDHQKLNPELGTPEDFDAFLAAMKAHDLRHILDTVPNHVGVGTNDNYWWNDVLENGRDSKFAGYFDITWDGSPRPKDHGKVLIPTLGGLYGDLLDKNELKLAFEEQSGTFSIHYYDRRFPIDPKSYSYILCANGHTILDELGEHHPDWRELATIRLECGDPGAAGVHTVKSRLAELVRRYEKIRAFIRRAVEDFNGPPAVNVHPLDWVLNQQNYRLAYWRVAPDEINYRRFFDINDLAALSMEKLEVFEAVHEFTLRLLAEGKLDGLRVDHPDGLYDPKEYFFRLQRYLVLFHARLIFNSDKRFAGQDWGALQGALTTRLDRELPSAGEGARKLPLFVSAEKILALDEPLPADWPIHGTSGYDALNMISGLFVDPAGEVPLTKLYADITGRNLDLHDLIYEKKKLILRISLASELRMLAWQLDGIAQRDRHSRDFTLTGMTDALRELIACFPVYRSYISDEGVRPEDVALIHRAIETTIRRNPKTEPAVFHFIRDVLLQRLPVGASSDHADAVRRFAGKFQQLTAPATAKGIEDTAFYIYNRLISLNEVGGEPAKFGISADELHRYFADRQARWPYALSSLSTHDTKRSEDVRARIHVLSELPDEWREHVMAWRNLNARHRIAALPDANEEYLLYQTLVGVWPFDASSADETLINRIQAFMQKAMREAKVNTSWTDVNADHESAVAKFVSAILDPNANAEFLNDFLGFQQKVAKLGMINSLSQTLLRLTAPGVPDTYQGTELWDLSLVDPDNRRPVDYQLRGRLLGELQAMEKQSGKAALAADVLRTPADGRVKLLTTKATLAIRRSHPALLSEGEYLPLQPQGPAAANAFAFARTAGDGAAALIVVPRLTSGLKMNPDGWPLGDAVWAETLITLPPALAQRSWTHAITGESLNPFSSVRVATLFKNFPVALWLAQ